MRRYWVRHHEPLDLPTLEQHDVPADHFYWNDHQVSIVDEETYNAWLAGNGPQDTNCIAYGPGDWQSVKWVDTSVVNKAHLDEIDDWLERHGQ